MTTLTARTYSEIDRVDIGGVTFLIGWIPRDKYAALALAGAKASRDALRRALAALKERGDLPVDEEERKKAVELEMRFDTVWTEALASYQRSLAAWGVAGHEGLRDGAGAAVDFVAVEREFLGRRYSGASEETVAVYADVPGLIEELYLAIAMKNALGADQKKVSPLPPSPTDGSSTAPTA